jgi:crotonobetainyl-CoA:carnitine CoA-transferase CaiB-like acyl-CoA transferase
MARGARVKRLPLEGVRIADLTMVWAGPYATRLLAEMGAEVIKIESPRNWDNLRTLVPQPGVEEPWNSAFYFNDYNRDKKSLSLDLARERGRELFLQLVPHCDVVIENYRADVLENLRLGYDVLRAVKPDIILVSMAGFGKTGSERDNVGYGPIIEQMAGLASLTGYGDDGVPYKTGISYGDPIAGTAAAGAVALALIQRRRTGQGCFIDLAQREVMSTMIGEAFVAASLRGESPVHRGNRDLRFVPQGVYRCRGEEQWIVISVRDDGEWRALADLIGTPALAALSRDERQARHDEIDALIAAWAAGSGPQQAMEALQAAGVAAGRVLDTVAIHDDPHLAARGFWVWLPHPKMHPWRQPSSAWRLVEANPQMRRHAPLFGEHNREILGGLLGLTERDLADLAATDVISETLINPTVG